jgi:hypothetical protein
MKLTRTLRRALRALADRGGEGVRTDRMTLLAGGAELGDTHDGDGWPGNFFAWSPTWLTLLRAGYLEEIAHRRYRLTEAGRAAARAGP